LAKELNIVELSGWAKVSESEISKRGGTALLKEYGSFEKGRCQSLLDNNVITALRAIYKDYDWDDAFNDRAVPYHHWKSQANQRKFFDKIAKDLGIRDVKEWDNVKLSEVLSRKGGHGVLEQNNNSLPEGNSLNLRY
jgi:hypothetical protein